MIALLPFQFFPSWDVLALSVKLTTFAAIPAVLITIYLKKDAGWVFNAILNVLIGVLILMFVGFVCTEMFHVPWEVERVWLG